MDLPVSGRTGQALVDAALALPCLLIILTGLYIAGRSVSLTGSSESAAMTQLLREGRRQASIGEEIAKSIFRHRSGVSIRTERDRVHPLVPAVLPTPEGRTRCIVQIDKEWNESGRIARWTALSARSRIEASVDSWDRESPSGKKAASAVRAYVLLRSIR